MRRIEFIAPVDAMRGNLSGNQDLRYPTSNNKAWDAPADKRSYANNYNTRYVGAKRSRDGHKYFSVKQRSATLINDNTRLQMALLAASSVIANHLTTDLRVQTQLSEFFEVSAARRSGWTFKRYLQDGARQGLAAKTHITFVAEGPVRVHETSVTISNPFISEALPSGGYDINEYFPAELLVKFWPQLASNPVLFTVDGMKGVAHTNDTIANIAASSYNVLSINATSNVKIGNMWMLNPSGDYCSGEDVIIPDGKYTLTDVNPAP